MDDTKKVTFYLPRDLLLKLKEARLAIWEAVGRRYNSDDLVAAALRLTLPDLDKLCEELPEIGRSAKWPW